MKKLLLITISFIVVGCSTTHPDYEANKKLAQKWVETFETGNIDLWEEVVSKDVIDISPMYGMGEINYEASKQIAEFYVNNYTDVKFNDPVWLPGIDTLTMKPDGSVRAYGVWTGTSKSTGRSFSLTSYHNFDFKDGKITSTGEYFDATGMINSVGPVMRNPVVFTAKVSKNNLDKFLKLMDTEAGLSMTRNYDGCSHLEALYHAETETYFAFSYWESYEKYETYLNWRLNDDQSGFVGKVYPLVKGGESGVKIHFNNSNYKFF